MTNSQNIQWKRIVVEAATIVVSILLAFAIDAAWDNRQDRKAEIDLLARVSTELSANAGLIQRKLDTLALAVQGTSKFLSWMGPEPDNVKRAELLEAWTNLYSIGTLTLTRDASQEYLAEGRIDAAANTDVRLSISQWYSGGDSLENRYKILREAHLNIGEYISDTIPTLHLDSAHPAMAHHPKSKFPFDQAALLSDPRMESRLSLYLIRMEFITAMASDLLEQQSKLVLLIDSDVL